MRAYKSYDYTYVCPFCGTEYDADEEEVLDFEDFECPFCGADVAFGGNEKREEY